MINATGVVIHTNLGRAPLPLDALDALEAIGSGYSNLEYDVEDGARGSRHAHVEDLLRELTGARGGAGRQQQRSRGAAGRGRARRRA